MKETKMKVKEYIKETQHPFILAGDVTASDWLKNETFQDDLSAYIRLHHGNLNIREGIIEDCTEEEVPVANFIQLACSNLYIVNRYKYNHLYETTLLQYDPIENYRSTETEDINASGTNTTSFQKGSQTNTDTNVKGSQTNSESKSSSIDAHTDDLEDVNTYGVVHETDNLDKIMNEHTDTHNRTLINVQRVDTHNKTLNYAEHTDKHDNGNNNGAVNNEHYVTSYESDTPHLESRDSLGATRDVIGGHEDTDNLEDTYGAHTDNDNLEDTYGEHTDSDNRTINKDEHIDTLKHTNEYGAQGSSETNSYVDGERTDTNTIVEGQRSDSENGSETTTSSRTLTRYGNIGVTTSQQMIESERKVALFNIYKVIAKDIIGCIANRCYGGF